MNIVSGELQWTSARVGAFVCGDGKLHRHSGDASQILRAQSPQGRASRILQVRMAPGVGCLDAHHGQKDRQSRKCNRNLTFRKLLEHMLHFIIRIRQIESYSIQRKRWKKRNKKPRAHFWRWSEQLCRTGKSWDVHACSLFTHDTHIATYIMLIAAGHLCGGTQLCDVPLHQCLWRNYWSGWVAAWQAMYSHYCWLLWAWSQPSYPQAHDPRRTQILPWQSTPRRQVIPDLPYLYIYISHAWSGDRSVCTV